MSCRLPLHVDVRRPGARASAGPAASAASAGGVAAGPAAFASGLAVLPPEHGDALLAACLLAEPAETSVP